MLEAAKEKKEGVAMRIVQMGDQKCSKTNGTPRSRPAKTCRLKKGAMQAEVHSRLNSNVAQSRQSRP